MFICNGRFEKSWILLPKNTCFYSVAYDFINGGHIAWSQGKISEALELYCKGLNLLQNNWEVFQDTFFEDKSHLLARGIKENEIPLMLDEILYNEGI